MEKFLAFLALLAFFLLYSIGLVVYRVWLSPVSHIPGPLIAKATYWYEFYWDVVLTGQYYVQIEKFHEQYGPIVRINPHEIHINDPDFYDVIYANNASGRKRDKWSWLYKSFGIPDATFATLDHELHRMRRAALNPFFSKAKIRALQGRIDEVVVKLLGRIQEFKGTGDPMPITMALSAVTNDIVSSYSFEISRYRTDAPDFAPDYHRASDKAAKGAHLMKHLPALVPLSQGLPDKMITSMDPDLGAYIGLQRYLQKQTKEIQTAYQSPDYKPPERSTIFHEILSSPHLPESQKHYDRLWQDATSVTIAGTITTQNALSNLVFFLLTDEQILTKVRDELFEAIPSKSATLDLTILESLPFFTAALTETLRIGNGVCSRLQRIDPDHPTTFHAIKDKKIAHSPAKDKTYVLPPGTPMSMTMMFIHFNEHIFPKPRTFDPSRWLDTDAMTAKPSLHRRLDKYFLPFSKGTRNCLGLHLAWAELYLVAASIFRRYGSKNDQRAGDEGYLELFETTYEQDIEIVADGLAPLTRRAMRGVMIKIRECDAAEKD